MTSNPSIERTLGNKDFIESSCNQELKIMARIVRFSKPGGPEVLKLAEEEVPPPSPGEVSIALKAIGLNRAEVMFRSGPYTETPE